MKVALFSARSFDHEYFEKCNTAGKNQITYFDSSLTTETLNLAVGFETVCVLVNDKIDAEVIEELSNRNIKLIALRSAGFDNVDIEAANENGIRVMRVPSYSSQAIAEHAAALILTLT